MLLAFGLSDTDHCLVPVLNIFSLSSSIKELLLIFVLKWCDAISTVGLTIQNICLYSSILVTYFKIKMIIVIPFYIFQNHLLCPLISILERFPSPGCLSKWSQSSKKDQMIFQTGFLHIFQKRGNIGVVENLISLWWILQVPSKVLSEADLFDHLFFT